MAEKSKQEPRPALLALMFAELGCCGHVRQVPGSPPGRLLRTAPPPSKVAPASPLTPPFRDQSVIRHTLWLEVASRRLSRTFPLFPGFIQVGNATSTVSVLAPEPAEASHVLQEKPGYLLARRALAPRSKWASCMVQGHLGFTKSLQLPVACGLGASSRARCRQLTGTIRNTPSTD